MASPDGRPPRASLLYSAPLESMLRTVPEGSESSSEETTSSVEVMHATNSLTTSEETDSDDQHITVTAGLLGVSADDGSPAGPRRPRRRRRRSTALGEGVFLESSRDSLVSPTKTSKASSLNTVRDAAYKAARPLKKKVRGRRKNKLVRASTYVNLSSVSANSDELDRRVKAQLGSLDVPTHIASSANMALLLQTQGSEHTLGSGKEGSVNSAPSPLNLSMMGPRPVQPAKDSSDRVFSVGKRSVDSDVSASSDTDGRTSDRPSPRPGSGRNTPTGTPRTDESGRVVQEVVRVAPIAVGQSWDISEEELELFATQLDPNAGITAAPAEFLLPPRESSFLYRSLRKAIMRFESQALESAFRKHDERDSIAPRIVSLLAQGLTLAPVFFVVVIRDSLVGGFDESIGAKIFLLFVLPIYACMTGLSVAYIHYFCRLPDNRLQFWQRASSKTVAMGQFVWGLVIYSASIIALAAVFQDCMQLDDEQSIRDCTVAWGSHRPDNTHEDEIIYGALPFTLVGDTVFLISVILFRFPFIESVCLSLFVILMCVVRFFASVAVQDGNFDDAERIVLNQVLQRVWIALGFSILFWTFDRQRRVDWIREVSMLQVRNREKTGSRFVQMVSHEIKTPLQVNALALDILSDAQLNSIEEEALKDARDANILAQNIVQSVLISGAIETGNFQLRRTLVNLELLIQSTVRPLARIAAMENLEVYSCIAKSCPELIFVDEGRVQQAIWNYVGNAVKYTERGSVGVFVSPAPKERLADVDQKSQFAAEDFLSFRVVDSGPGIPEGAESKLFERGIRMNDGTGVKKSDGVGLGLSVIRDLTLAWGGSCWGQSRTDGKTGAEFGFTVSIGGGKRASFGAHLPIITEAEEFDDVNLSPTPTRLTSIPEQTNSSSSLLRSSGSRGSRLSPASDESEISSGDSFSYEEHFYSEPASLTPTGLLRDVDGVVVEQSSPGASPTNPRRAKSGGTRTLVPVLRLRSNSDSTPTPTATVSDKPENDSASPCVLLADDNAMIRRLATNIINRVAPSCRVFTASDGAEAATVFRSIREQCAVVFLDLQMPVASGVAGVREMRAEELRAHGFGPTASNSRHGSGSGFSVRSSSDAASFDAVVIYRVPRVPIFALTGSAIGPGGVCPEEEAEGQTMEALGFDGVLMKPTTAQSIYQVLASVLKPSQVVQPVMPAAQLMATPRPGRDSASASVSPARPSTAPRSTSRDEPRDKNNNGPPKISRGLSEFP